MDMSAVGSQRPDCVAGHEGLELRNVVANYAFERSRGSAHSEPNSGQQWRRRFYKTKFFIGCEIFRGKNSLGKRA
jgi:hypothetical protein